MNKQIPMKTNDEWKGHISIPPILSTSQGLTKIINVAYKLICYVNIKRSNDIDDLEIPVIIGTKNTSFANKCSLSFEECKFDVSKIPIELKSDLEIFEKDEENFKPLYPIYRNID